MNRKTFEIHKLLQFLSHRIALATLKSENFKLVSMTNKGGFLNFIISRRKNQAKM